MSDSLRFAGKLIKTASIIFLVNIIFLSHAALGGESLPKRPYIDWWGDGKTLKNVTIVSATPMDNIEYWRNRDVLSSGFVGLSNEDPGYIPTGDSDGLRIELEKRVAEGFESIALEVERNTDLSDARVLNEFKADHPGIFVTAWMLGLDNRHPYKELKEGIDLFINEVYIDYGHKPDRFKKFVEMAKRKGILEKSVFAVSIESTSLSDTEEQFQLIRTIAPGMPGIAIFYYRGIPKDVEIDALTAKYFIGPLITIPSDRIEVLNDGPRVDKKIALTVRVANIGYTKAEVSVDIYDGDPEKKGKLLRSGVGRSVLNGQEEKDIDFSLRFSEGEHQIFTVLNDSEGVSLKEKREATIEISVRKKIWWEHIIDFLAKNIYK